MPCAVCIEKIGLLIMAKRHFILNLVFVIISLLSGQIIFGAPVFAVNEPSITLNPSQLQPLNLFAGAFGSVTETVGVTTNNYTGYSAYLINRANSTDLVNTSDSSLTIPTITLPSGRTSILASEFDSGYGISIDGTNYLPAPTSADTISIGSSNSSGTSSQTVTFGVKIDVDVVAGSYDKTFVFAVLANNPQYSITYNANAGSDTVTGMPNNQATTITTADTITLSSDTPSRSDYAFLGWDTDATATTPTYPVGETNTITIDPTQSNNVTLYAIWRDTGTVQITSIQYVSGINVSGTPSPSVDNEGNIDFDLTFFGGQDNTNTLQATYQLTITNTSHSGYTFTAPSSNLILRISDNEWRDISYELEDIAVGDTIPARSTVTFKVILSADYVSGQHGTEGGINVEPVNQTTPSLIGSIYGSNTGDLSGNHTLTSFQISVESTFEESQTFTIGSLSPDFEIVDSSGNALGAQTIAAGATSTYTFYMKTASGAKFASETATAGIIISYNSTYTNVGEVRITVDKDVSFVDSQSPTISGVTITKNKTTSGEATLSWTGMDNVGIASYGIYKCDNTDGCGNMISVSGATNSYTFTGMPGGTYYFIVVGFDDAGNTASQNDINSANANPGPASRTDAELRWVYNVTATISHGTISHTSGTSITAGGTYQGKISATSSAFDPYQLPSAITVIMDNVTLSTSDYEYISSGTNAGRVTVNNVSGDIQIKAEMEQSCLIEGTEIMLADGTTKPVEDITYHDKLKVWNYETGKVDEAYPAWIEKARVVLGYQKTTLEDGTVLKTHGWHGVFDVLANEFISIDDRSKLFAGVNIYKVEDNRLASKRVVSVEHIAEEVTIYHVVSANYYNVIANGVLTTDGVTVLSNLYGFDNNLKWPSLRNQIIADSNNLYTYSDFKDIGLPEKMFNELRVREAKYLCDKYGITLDQFKQYLLANQLNPKMWLPYDY